MIVEKVIVGDYQTNCYVVTKDDKTIIIDPGDNSDKIIKACEGKNIVGILVTHYHFDHIGALDVVENYFGIRKSVNVDGFEFQIIETPGHTSDSISFYFPAENIMFTGDFLFYHTIGRTDLPTGNNIEMINSLKMISSFDDKIIIYPGHGKESILRDEKKYFSEYINYLCSNKKEM